MVQAAWGERPRESVVEDLRRLFDTVPKPGNGYVWAALTGTVCDFHAPELLPEARQAFAEKLVDESILGLDWIEKELAEIGEKRFTEFRERNTPIDAATECSGWLCFRDEDEELGPWEDDEDMEERATSDSALGPLANEFADAPREVPYVAPPKVGRNDPCPCGSGKKYKKCCGNPGGPSAS
jgi:hypothetical protein